MKFLSRSCYIFAMFSAATSYSLFQWTSTAHMHNKIYTKNNTIYLKYFFSHFHLLFSWTFFLLLSIQLFISLFYFFLLLFQGNRFPQVNGFCIYLCREQYTRYSIKHWSFLSIYKWLINRPFLPRKFYIVFLFSFAFQLVYITWS